ncbi:hypothetical protein [Amycolatopsis pigmentata]|uniref:YbaB/EbfC DNA-binding family protein n=1 Tax=Amycolatopsis pigmentata TaxID=450801 RepID=A0ABW5G8U9_9PSEU
MDGDRWGFEEAEDWEYEQLNTKSAPKPAEEPTEAFVGQDSGRVVAVLVSPDGEVMQVKLSPVWRQSVEPWDLPGRVRSAANAATMRALASSVERFDSTAPVTPVEPQAGAEESSLTSLDVQRLLDAVSEELDQFTERLAEVVDHRAQVQSAGGHVQGSAQRGQVLSLDIDPNWAGQARHSEIETELLEVLRGLHDRSAPGELAAGPSGSAISELMDLAADPRRLMRRLGMPD